MLTLDGNCIFTNTALTDDGDVWWEGMTDEPPAHLTDWKGDDWTPESEHARRPPQRPVHRPGRAGPGHRARVGGPRRACPSTPSSSAGAGRRSCRWSTEAFDWQHGVFLGSIMASETTAAAEGAVGKLRRDPFAMLPFCGYNMADYLGHWLEIGDATRRRRSCPKIFYVNWFRKDADGRCLWPGFGENSRVLEWVFERVSGRGDADETPIGCVPAKGAIDTDGLDVPDDDLAELLRVDADEWRPRSPPSTRFYDTFGDRVPAELRDELRRLETRLSG